MENLNFDNRIHEQNGLYCLNDIAEKLIGSTNIKEYMKKIPNKEYINGNCYITKDHMIEILLKSKADVAKKYLEYLKKKDNIDKDLAEVKINPHPNYPMGCGDLSNYDLTPSRDPQLLNQVLNQKMILMYIH